MSAPRRFPPPALVRQKVDIRHPQHDGMLGVSDSQLRSIWAAATGLPIEKRGVFLGRVIAQLQLCGSHFTTADINDAVRLALEGLIQKSAA